MSFKALVLRSLAVGALAVASGGAQAAFTVYTSAADFAAATSAPGVDGFTDLSSRPIDSPLVRNAGAYGYTASATTQFYVVGSMGNPYLSTDSETDSITFSNFTGGVRAIGGNFFGTDFAGDFSQGPLSLTATDADGSFTQLVNSSSTSGFLGFVSTGALTSLVLQAALSTDVYPAVDNLVLAQVSPLAAIPEPATYAMLLAGLGVMGMVARRRKTRTTR